ncbi:MAG: hypothetical protein IPH86_17465 [bacterium]|nr:hypothetical protein [bacterium]
MALALFFSGATINIMSLMALVDMMIGIVGQQRDPHARPRRSCAQPGRAVPAPLVGLPD